MQLFHIVHAMAANLSLYKSVHSSRELVKGGHMVHSVLLASPRGPTALKTHTYEDADAENVTPSNKCVQIEGFKKIRSCHQRC